MEYTKLLRKLAWNPASRSSTAGLGIAMVADGVYALVGHLSPDRVSAVQNIFSDQEWAIYLSLAASAAVIGLSAWGIFVELPRVCYLHCSVSNKAGDDLEAAKKSRVIVSPIQRGNGESSPLVSGVRRDHTPTVKLVLAQPEEIKSVDACLRELDALCVNLVDRIDAVYKKTSSKMPCLPGGYERDYGTMRRNDNLNIETRIAKIKPFIERYQNQLLNQHISVISTVGGSLSVAENMHQKKLTLSENADKQAALKQRIMNAIRMIKREIEECEKDQLSTLYSSSASSISLNSSHE